MQKLHEASTSDITPADKANDRTSLLRNTPGFLYLMIHNASGWVFPSLEYDAEKYKTTRTVGIDSQSFLVGSRTSGCGYIWKGLTAVFLGLSSLFPHCVVLSCQFHG